MCIFRGPEVLRKAVDQFVSTEKKNVLLKIDFLAKASEVLHVSDNNFESQTVFG